MTTVGTGVAGGQEQHDDLLSGVVKANRKVM